MATPIKRIEKDFLLKVLYDEQIPIMVLYNRTEYIVHVEKPPKIDMFLKADRPVSGLRPGHSISFTFDYRGQVISFSAVVNTVKEEQLSISAPEFLYKNLARSFTRVSSPSDMSVQFTFHGDRYKLSFPKVQEYEQEELVSFIDGCDPKDLKDLINQLAVWADEVATGYKLNLFRNAKPSSTEEKILAETGKSLFLPSTHSDFPGHDPYPKNRLITEGVFKRFLESSGVDRVFVDDALARFLKAKRDNSIFSDAWVPILFHEYVIGYIHLWIGKSGKPPFDFGILDTLYQFAKVLAFSLKENGYFNDGIVKKEAFQGKVVDISASGMLFAYPHSALSSSLLPDCELDLQLLTPKRTIRTGARIVRRYKDASMGYFGCRFLDIAPEDMRFLFEFIYGKPFTDQDASFLAGNV